MKLLGASLKLLGATLKLLGATLKLLGVTFKLLGATLKLLGATLKLLGVSLHPIEQFLCYANPGSFFFFWRPFQKGTLLRFRARGLAQQLSISLAQIPFAVEIDFVRLK